jgi:2-dehydropantoate 2-reductase
VADTPQILIVGTGAMAGLFGARLAVHAEVTLLGTWEQGMKAVRRDGIQLEENGQLRQVKVAVASGPEQCAGTKTALVLVKSWQTAGAAQMLSQCLTADGVALTLQNGLGNLEILESALGKGRAAMGVTTSGATLVGPGRVRAGGAGPTHVAPHPRLEQLVDLLRSAGFEVHPAEDLASLVWGKLAINAGINPVTALLEVPNGELLQRPRAHRVMVEAARETAAVAAASSIELPYADAATAVEQVAERTATNSSSMLQDIQRGAPTEVDAISGAIVKEGRRLGIQTPVNWTLWSLVRAKAKTK